MPRLPTSRLGRTARFGKMAATAAIKRDDPVAAADQIVDTLGSMKGAAMKIGQVLSTIDFDFVAEEDRERFKERLASLRDQAPAVPFRQMERLLAKELDAPVGEVFAHFDTEAVAAASIGQVYRARLRDGRDVAVKVQYPGIAEAVETDLRNMNLLFPLIRRVAPGVDVKALGAELRERIAEELDYEIEAQHQRRVARVFRGHPHVVVPDVMTSLSTRRVLVTEFVEGAPFAAVRTRDEATRDRVAEVVHRFYLDTAGRLDLALGDPHPGNFLLAGDGRLCFLDFGMVRALPRRYLAEREGRVYRALRDGDPAGVRAAMAGLGYLPEGWSHPDELLYAHMRLSAGWMLDVEQPHRFGSGAASELVASFGELGPQWRAMVRDFDVPREALLLRRMENVVFAVCADLRAAADWRALADELLAGEPPRTALGREHAAWLARRAA